MAIGNEVARSISQNTLKGGERYITRDGSLTAAAQARLLSTANKVQNPDSLLRAAKFADGHNAFALAADLRQRDALVRNDFEAKRFGKDFPVFGQPGNRDFMQPVIDGKTVGTQADMLSQLTDPTRLDANSGTAQVATAMTDIGKVFNAQNMYSTAAANGLLAGAMELKGGDIPLQTARILSATTRTAPTWDATQLTAAVQHIRQMPNLSDAAAKHLDLGLGQAQRALAARSASIAELDKAFTKTTQPSWFARTFEDAQPVTEVRRDLNASFRGQHSTYDWHMGNINRTANEATTPVLNGALANVANLPLAHAARTIDQPAAIQTQFGNLLKAKVEAGDWQLYKASSIRDWHSQFANNTVGTSESAAASDVHHGIFNTITESAQNGEMALASTGSSAATERADVQVEFDRSGHTAPPATVESLMANPGDYIIRRKVPGAVDASGQPQREFVPLSSTDSRSFFRLAEQEIRDAAPKS